MTLVWVIISTIFVSLISLVGVFTLALKDEWLKKIVSFLVNLSIGVLIGVAFLDLIPEAQEKAGNSNIFFYVLIGFFLFFLIEKIFHWRHCHEEDCPIHSFAYINLLGDAVHNLTDGLIIGASFFFDFRLGLITVLAVVLHEIPHEIGNFGVLVYAGFKKTKALFFNFITALTAILGGILGFFLSGYINNFIGFCFPLLLAALFILPLPI
jgi:zinc and cadmium transporter